jgi:hypothetical protein
MFDNRIETETFDEFGFYRCRCQPEHRVFWPEDGSGMGFKCEHTCRNAFTAGNPNCLAKHSLMSAVKPVEIADGNHAAPQVSGKITRTGNPQKAHAT